MAASNTRQRKSISERTASSAENSTSSVYWRALDGVHRLLQHLLRLHLELLRHVDRRGGDEGVDAAALRGLQRLGGAIDVAVERARQPADGAVAHGAGDGPDRLEVAGAGDGEARLDDVN